MTYLSHHGVKGQRWGIKNGPPYPIVDKGVIKKGTVLNTVTTSYRSPLYVEGDTDGGYVAVSSEEHSNGMDRLGMYDPRNEIDKAIYEGSIALKNIRDTGALSTVHTYELTKDLKVATDKDRLDAFKQLYKENKKEIEYELKRINKNENEHYKSTIDWYKEMLETNKKLAKNFKRYIKKGENDQDIRDRLDRTEKDIKRYKEYINDKQKYPAPKAINTTLKNDEDFEKAFYKFTSDNKAFNLSNKDRNSLGTKYIDILSEKADVTFDYTIKKEKEYSQRPLMLLRGKIDCNDALKHIGSHTLTEKEIDAAYDKHLEDGFDYYTKREQEFVKKSLKVKR